MATLQTRRGMLRITDSALRHGMRDRSVLTAPAPNAAPPTIVTWDADKRVYRYPDGTVFEDYRLPVLDDAGRLVESGSGLLEGEWAVETSLTYPVDLLIALSRELRTQDLDRLGSGAYGFSLTTFVGIGLLGKQGDRSTLDRRNLLKRWKREGVGDLFLAAAREGEKGRLSPEIARHLGRVRFIPGVGAEVEDYLALAAFALHEAVMRNDYSVRDCKLCGLPFLASPRANYCKRAAPQSREQSCQKYAKVRDHRARKKEEKSG